MKSDDFLSEVFGLILNMNDDNKKPVKVVKETDGMENNKAEEPKSTMRLSPPWVTYVNKLKVMFGRDPEIEIQFDDDTPEVKLFVANQRKYEALQHLLPDRMAFGNVNMIITLVPANQQMTGEQIICAAFEGNPVFSQVVTVSGVYENPITYAMFEKEAVQYWNDNMGDPHGVTTTLYQDIAESIFKRVDGVMYSTESDAKAGK